MNTLRVWTLVLTLGIGLITPGSTVLQRLEAQSAMGPPPGLLILPTGAAADATASAFQGEQLRQMLTVRLVNRGMYRVVSPLAVEATLRQEELLPSDLVDPEILRRVAEALDIDYVLSSSLTTIASGGTWAILLTNPHSEETIWSTIQPVSPGRPMDAVRAVTEQLDTFGRDVRLVQLDDIRRLVEAGEVSRAETLHRRYTEIRPTTPESRELLLQIEELRADEHYRTARDLAELWLFQEAMVEINRALALQPEREDLARYVDEIRRLQREAQQAGLREHIDVVTALIDEGYYESARMVLTSRDWDEEGWAGATAGDESSEPPDIVALREAVDEALGARQHYRDALTAYWEGNYSEARAGVITAIQRVPDRPEYGRLLAEIDRAASNRSSSDLVWEGYRTRLAAWSVKGSLLGPVDVLPSWEVTVGRGRFAYRDTDTAGETSIDQRVLTGSYRRPYLLSPGQNTPVVSLYAGWLVAASLRGGGSESITDTGAGDGTRRITGEGLWSLAAAGGGFLQARLFGFSLEGGLEVNNHLLFATRLDRDPTADRDSRSLEAAWMPGLDWFAGGSWHWNRDNRVVLRYTATILSRVIPEFSPDTERYRPTSFAVGWGRSLQ